VIKVLVVDDDKLVRQGLISAMPWSDFEMEVVGEASNGEKALEFLERHEVDLLLTDLAMPVMSGIELMRAVRHNYPSLYIVVLTLHQDFEYIQEALRLGAIDYIAKVQLERERFDEVLGRVHARIQEERRVRLPAPPEPDESVVAELREEWLSLEWLREEESAFEGRLRRLRDAGLPSSRLESIVFVVESEWGRVFAAVPGNRPPVPKRLEHWSEAEAWFREARRWTAEATGTSLHSAEVSAAIMKAIAIVKDEWNGPLLAADVAKRVNMSRSYFSQCFKDISGKPFNEYVRMLRMEKAKEYLIHTAKPIQWVAEQTGYQDEKYFSRLFREYTGVLPSEYRGKSSR